MKKLLIALLMTLPMKASAEESAAFLKIGVGARALGMGGAFTAIADDVSAIAWNPAGLSRLTKRELGAMHAELVADTRYDFIGYAHPTSRGTFAAGTVYLSQGAIEGRDASGRPTGGFSAADTAVNFGYAARLTQSLRLGGNVKYIKSTIASASASSYALDVGGMYSLGILGPGSVQLGVAAQNMGPGMRYLDERSPLPLTVAVGTAYHLPIGVTMSADYKNRPYGRTSEVSVGTEYSVISSFAVRMGYGSAKSLSGQSSGIAALNGFAAGFGLKAYGYSLDYAITPFGELGNVQRLSLGARF